MNLNTLVIQKQALKTEEFSFSVIDGLSASNTEGEF